MPASSANRISQLVSYLHKCGYASDLLREDYVYADAKGTYSIPLAAFADQSFDARSACLAIADASNLGESALAPAAASYRGFGAPLVFLLHDSRLLLWKLSRDGAVLKERILKSEWAAFFGRHKDDFSPARIYRAKNLGRLDTEQQLEFVDAGLMPVLEEEMGKELARLMEQVLNTLRSQAFTPAQLKLPQNQKWLFKAAFWLLAAKLLHDKGVRNFRQLSLQDVSMVLSRVKRHYGAEIPLEVHSPTQELALHAAAAKLKDFSSLANLTVEALGNVYEQVLVTPDLRKALGIHATPQYLVDYIVWQLWPWIKDIPEAQRVILEPTCGHAPFLTSAMRLLRELYSGDPDQRHDYLQQRLVGLEKDSFAREIARLSLTLADIPNPNGWKLIEEDVYANDTLSAVARNATILLSNPPFEDFTPGEQAAYRAAGISLRSFNKATEVLWRTLPHMPANSVFGVILPQGFLHAKESAALRQHLLHQFELREICCLPENVFVFARHKSVVLLGKKLTAEAAKSHGDNETRVVRVEKHKLQSFTANYSAPYEVVPQSRFAENACFDLRLPPLHAVWQYCESAYETLAAVADGGKGLEYKGKNLPAGAKTISNTCFKGAVRGFAKFPRKLNLVDLPAPVWMNLDPKVIRRPQWGTETGVPQVLMNYARTSQGPWRLKALLDREGHSVTSNFLVLRPTNPSWNLQTLWAVCNSPLANAYVFCNSMERHNLSGTIRNMPLPPITGSSLSTLKALVENYFALYPSDGVLQADVNKAEARQRMLAIDAEVMRLYDLPPEFEKQVLEFFSGWKRPGVDFDFRTYYPPGSNPYIPLHVLISPEYKASTAAFAAEWVEKNRSPEVCKAFENAVKAFKE
ncbi:MAG: N-6 DNA methylase [Phycisphaerae bacterium]|nr:N-6 DNA methylase [Phycisphaerae bacterium]